MNDTLATTWFNADVSLPSLTASSIVVGGTHLLHEFFLQAKAMQCTSELTIATPFIDVISAEYLSAAMNGIASSVTLTLMTTPQTAEGNAVDKIAGIGWRSFQVWARRKLHSKIYLSRPERGRPIALLGSHNLTEPGRRSNEETGVLLLGSGSDALGIIEGLNDRVCLLKRQAQLVRDSSTLTVDAANAA